MILSLIIVSLLVSLVPTANGLQCYECINCNGIGTLKTCGENEKYCQVKIIFCS